LALPRIDHMRLGVGIRKFIPARGEVGSAIAVGSVLCCSSISSDLTITYNSRPTKLTDADTDHLYASKLFKRS
jgi:hypothetical protein